MFVTGIRNEAYEKRVGTYKRVGDEKIEKSLGMHFVKNWLSCGWGSKILYS